jgi:hypothetical protein
MDVPPVEEFQTNNQEGWDDSSLLHSARSAAALRPKQDPTAIKCHPSKACHAETHETMERWY